MTEETSNIEEAGQTRGAPELSGYEELSVAELEQVAGGKVKPTGNTSTSGSSPNPTFGA